MEQWNDLSLSDRAAYIKLAVQEGVYDLPSIHSSYDSMVRELSKEPRENSGDDASPFHLLSSGGPLDSLPKPFSFRQIPIVRY